MRRPTKMKVVLANADNNPDFYELNLIAPLPKSSATIIPGVTNPAKRTDREYYELLLSAQHQKQQSDATSELITRRENNESERTNNVSLVSQQEYQSKQQRASVAQQNRAALLEANGNTPIASSPKLRNNRSSGSGGDSNSSLPDVNQLENLKKKREELLHQLHQLDMQAIASFPSAIDTFGSTISGGGNAQVPSSHIVAPVGTSLPLQQLTNHNLAVLGGVPVATLQSLYPIATNGIGLTGLSYLNAMPGNVGLNGDVNGFNQQLLMQQRLINGGNSMGLGTSLLDINNTSSASLAGSRVNQLELLAQRQSQLQLQLQQQQQQNEQQQFGVFGNVPRRGPPYT